MENVTPTEEDIKDWLDVKECNPSEVAVGVHRALQGHSVWMTHMRKDGDLCTDVLTSKPASGKQVGSGEVEVIQVKWTEGPVSKSAIEDFAEAQEKTSKVDTWTLFTPSGVSKTAEKEIGNITVETYSKSVPELVLDSLRFNGLDAGAFFEKYDSPFEMEHIERIGGDSVDQLLIPKEVHRFLTRNSQSKRWVANVGQQEAGNVFQIVPLDGQRREVKDVEPVREEVTSDGKILLGERKYEEFLAKWGERTYHGSPRNILATRIAVEGIEWS